MPLDPEPLTVTLCKGTASTPMPGDFPAAMCDPSLTQNPWQNAAVADDPFNPESTSISPPLFVPSARHGLEEIPVQVFLPEGSSTDTPHTTPVTPTPGPNPMPGFVFSLPAVQSFKGNFSPSFRRRPKESARAMSSAESLSSERWTPTRQRSRSPSETPTGNGGIVCILMLKFSSKF
jgi:hypothetical protein